MEIGREVRATPSPVASAPTAQASDLKAWGRDATGINKPGSTVGTELKSAGSPNYNSDQPVANISLKHSADRIRRTVFATRNNLAGPAPYGQNARRKQKLPISGVKSFKSTNPTAAKKRRNSKRLVLKKHDINMNH